MATWILNNYENLYVAAMMILSVIFIVCDMKWYWIPDLLLLILAVMAGSVIFMIALHAVAPQQTGSGDVKLFALLAPTCDGIGAYLMLVAAFVTGACAALPVRFIKKNTLVPFAPFILGGWWVVGQWGAFLEDILL